MAAAGLPVPRPLLWVRRGSSSLVVLEYHAHARTLRGALEAGEPCAPALDELARLTASMHAAGWYHRDLYLEHLLVTGDGLVLIDAGRARQDPLPRLRWLAKDLAALSSSAPDALDFARLRFLVRWRRALARAGRPVDVRVLVADIARRAARMRAHTPRHQHRSLDPATPAG
ncbi:MAG: lipopolysaccharide kinase InaA family protein [Planctomycetota bacterium]|nr:lipopolysaccharide kinase InaA family protein [Planctomycetota bacterium]